MLGRRHCNTRRYPRDSLNFHAVTGSVFNFFRTPSKNKWITPFKPDNMPVRIRPTHDEFIDLILLVGVTSFPLTHEDVLGLGRMVQQIGMYKSVIEYHMCRSEGPDPLQSDKLRITGTGPDQG
jgi:hypothetical protein